MAVVGEGCGDYVHCTTYKYVGMGAGNMGLLAIPARGCSCWWMLCFLWLLPLLLLIPSTTTTTTTTTTTAISLTTPTPPPDIIITTTGPPPDKPVTTTQGPRGYCKIFGESHVVTFDGSHASVYSQGEYWVVKSDTVWMQGRYLPTPVTNGLTVMKEPCIGGPSLESAKGQKNGLCVCALAAFFNGAPIIPGFPDSWSHKNPAIEVTTDASGQLLQASRTGKPMHVVHIKLPLNIEVQINRWNEPGEGDYINALIRMSSQPNQFNGNPADDTRPLIRSRIGTTGAWTPRTCCTTSRRPSRQQTDHPEMGLTLSFARPDLNNCPTDKTEMAKRACANSCKNGIPSKECMIDVCFGAPHFAELTDYDC